MEIIRDFFQLKTKNLSFTDKLKKLFLYLFYDWTWFRFFARLASFHDKPMVKLKSV